MADLLGFIFERLLGPIIGPDIAIIGGVILIVLALLIMAYFELPFEGIVVILIPLLWEANDEGLLPEWFLIIAGLICGALIFMGAMRLFNR